ncbi:MAG: hypothetical protein LBQ28_02575 [Prevotellaceae bacterium]|jgi:hypothetical protein|nr:hypothetical protein [Prevotellaceae bacterium]
MEFFKRNFYLIGGLLLLLCCALPFASSVSGFGFFAGYGIGFIATLGVLLILIGAVVLTFIPANKDTNLTPKVKLSFAAKLAAIIGGGLVFIWVLSYGSEYGGKHTLGAGLIFALIFAIALLCEKQLFAAIEKQNGTQIASDKLLKPVNIIGGVLLLIFCLLPFISVSLDLGYFGSESKSANAFGFFEADAIKMIGSLPMIGVLFILIGAAALIFVSATKDIPLTPKISLSLVAKLVALVGGLIVIVLILVANDKLHGMLNLGIGLIFVLIVDVILLFDKQIVAAIGKK